MKKRMQKMISLTMVIILLLTAFVGCSDANLSEKDVIPPLSEKLELEFKELFCNNYKDEYPLQILEASKLNYLGEFNGSHAVIFEFISSAYQTDHYEVVGGFEFAYDNRQPIIIIRDGEMYDLKNAHDSGMITDEDLAILFKRYRPTCEATVNDEFSTKTIIVRVMPSSNFKEYTPKDFSEVNCIETRELFEDRIHVEDKIGRYLVLTVRSYSKKTILKYIKELEKRDDIYDASPDYIGGID